MSSFEAGFGRVEITPHNMNLPLLGYGTREHGTRIGNAQAVHDPLWARAMAVRQGDAAWALCALDLVGVDAQTVAQVRGQVAQRTGLKPEAILISTIHTHSGPRAQEAANWNRPFSTLVADAIVEAWEGRRPAQAACGAGVLYGHSINRRWLDRPVDPGVGVLRVDTVTGELLGVVVNFGLHAVVLGGDNLLISADYVGYARDQVEKVMGGTCLFTNGGGADVNPLTQTVRRQLAEGRPFVTMTEAHYYGEGPDPIYIEERKGGTFAEAEDLGRAVGQEVTRVALGLRTAPPDGTPWSAQAWVNRLDQGEDLIETQAMGVGNWALVSQPGEVFVETALAIKARLREFGYPYPWLVSYANDWQGYLVPEAAYREGGYEVERARTKGQSPKLQERLWAGISPLLPRHPAA
jgi:hypothetical protein